MRDYASQFVDQCSDIDAGPLGETERKIYLRLRPGVPGIERQFSFPQSKHHGARLLPKRRARGVLCDYDFGSAATVDPSEIRLLNFWASPLGALEGS